MDILIKNPKQAVVTEHTSLSTKGNDLTKPITFLFLYMYKHDIIGEKYKMDDVVENAFDAIFMEFFGRSLAKECHKIKEFFEISDKDLKSIDNIDLDELFRKVKQLYLSTDKQTQDDFLIKFFNESSLKKSIQKDCDSIQSSSDYSINVELVTTYFNKNSHKNLNSFLAIYKNLTYKNYNQEKFIMFINHTSSYF